MLLAVPALPDSPDAVWPHAVTGAVLQSDARWSFTSNHLRRETKAEVFRLCHAGGSLEDAAPAPRYMAN